MTLTLHSYPKVLAIGHKYLESLFDNPVVIEEKVDGSQFSFGVIEGTLYCRSRNQNIVLESPEKMFTKAVDTARSIQHLLTDGYIYRCEYLGTPKHNTLAYDRVPEGYLVLFDVEIAEQNYLTPAQKVSEAGRLGLEPVPVIHFGLVEDPDTLKDLLNRVSVLGGQEIEGIVVKNYDQFGSDGKFLVGKYVSERFKEVHKGDWRKRNPASKDILGRLITTYRTPARWEKAIQHLREAGTLQDAPQDIGPLMKEIQVDFLEEEEASVKDDLFNYYKKGLLRGITSGFPEWYKERLLEKAFE